MVTTLNRQNPLRLDAAPTEIQMKLGISQVLSMPFAYNSPVIVLDFEAGNKNIIKGRFKDAIRPRVFEFEIGDSIVFKPFTWKRTDSLDVDPVAWEDYSKGYCYRFDAVKTVRKEKPTCGNTSYNCGKACIGLNKNCKSDPPDKPSQEKVDKLRAAAGKFKAVQDDPIKKQEDNKLTPKPPEIVEPTPVSDASKRAITDIERIKSGQHVINKRDGYSLAYRGRGVYDLNDLDVPKGWRAKPTKLTEKEATDFLAEKYKSMNLSTPKSEVKPTHKPTEQKQTLTPLKLALKIGKKSVNLTDDLDSYRDLKLTADPVLGWQVINKNGEILREPPNGNMAPSHRFKKREQAENFANDVMTRVEKLQKAQPKPEAVTVTPEVKAIAKPETQALPEPFTKRMEKNGYQGKKLSISNTSSGKAMTLDVMAKGDLAIHPDYAGNSDKVLSYSVTHIPSGKKIYSFGNAFGESDFTVKRSEDYAVKLVDLLQSSNLKDKDLSSDQLHDIAVGLHQVRHNVSREKAEQEVATWKTPPSTKPTNTPTPEPQKKAEAIAKTPKTPKSKVVK